MSHGVSGQSSLLSMQYHASTHSQYHLDATQLGGQPVTKMSNVYWVYLRESASLCGQHLSQTSCSLLLAPVWAVQVMDVSTVGPTVGAKLLS